MIEFHNGTFHACINLDKLAGVPKTRLRKLFLLMLGEPYENKRAIETLSSWLPAVSDEAKAELTSAGAAYSHGWRNIPKAGQRNKEEQMQAKKNRQLLSALKSAKRQCDELQKVRDVLQEAKTKLKY